MIKCPNCKAEIDFNSKFCEYCGKEIINNEENESKEDKITKEEYYKYFIGENYNNFKNSFNIFALIFGGLYIFYRKQYLLGTIFIIISLSTIIINPIIAMVLHILLGIIFNQQYLKYVNKKTSDIRIKNINKSKEEILIICKKKGQTSILSSMASIIISLLIILLILKIGGTNLKGKQGKPIVKVSNNEINSLTYKIPDNFDLGNYNKENYKTYTYNENRNYCRIIIQTNKDNNNQSIEDYISKSIYRTNKDTLSTPEDITINTKVWKKTTVKNTAKTTTYYSIKYNDIFYTVSYVTYNNTYCNNDYTSFMKSLNFK